MNKLLFIALTMAIGSSAFAKTDPGQNAVVAVAQSSIVNYGLFRMGGLGGAFGIELTQNRICGLSGMAFTGFQVLEAAGLSEKEIADLLKGLLKFRLDLTVDLIRSSLSADNEDCTK